MCGVEILLCLACGAGAGGLAAWKARGAMTHKGKVVVDQQGRVLGKDGKLLKDKKGAFVYVDKDVKDKKKSKGGPVADSGETHRRNAKAHKNISSTSKIPTMPSSANKIPFSNKNRSPSPPQNREEGAWSPSEMNAWQSHLKENRKAL